MNGMKLPRRNRCTEGMEHVPKTPPALGDLDTMCVLRRK